MKFATLSSASVLFTLALAITEPEPEPIDQGTTAKPHLVLLHSNAPEPPVLGTARKFVIGSNRAYAGNFDAATLARLRQSTAVKAVAPDGVVSAFAKVTQIPSEPGLGALSRTPVGSYGSYIYDNKVCTDKYAYVIDTGIRISHQEFGGRASYGYNFVGKNNNANDDNGHGTHCAGTVGGAVYGVFKSARLIAVKVLDAGGSGYWSDVIAGIAWTVSDATARNRIGNSVISMSLGGGDNPVVDAMVNAAVLAGIPNFVAAGNNNADAAFTSPAKAQYAFAVGAHSSNNDCRAYFSNYGSKVKMYAPGVDVRAAYYTCDTCTAVLSGTSMATPHVAGLALYFMCQSGYNTPASVQARLLQCAHSRPTNCAAPYDYKSTDPNEIAFNCIV